MVRLKKIFFKNILKNYIVCLFNKHFLNWFFCDEDVWPVRVSW